MPKFLFDREFSLTVGATKIATRAKQEASDLGPAGEKRIRDTLRVQFSVEKTLGKDPNKARVEIWNLNEEHRKKIQKQQDVTIEAGYVDQTEQIFFGSIVDAVARKESTDWVIRIEAMDGILDFASRTNETFGPGVPLAAVFQKAVADLKIGKGNALAALADAPRQITQYAKGLAVNGRSIDVVDKLCSAAGLQWSVQDGQFLLVEPKGTSSERIVALSSDSSIIGSPEVSGNGNMRLRALLQGRLKPGREIQVTTSSIFEGRFRIEKVVHSGDLYGQDWYSDLECIPL